MPGAMTATTGFMGLISTVARAMDGVCGHLRALARRPAQRTAVPCADGTCLGNRADFGFAPPPLRNINASAGNVRARCSFRGPLPGCARQPHARERRCARRLRSRQPAPSYRSWALSALALALAGAD